MLVKVSNRWGKEKVWRFRLRSYKFMPLTQTQAGSQLLTSLLNATVCARMCKPEIVYG